MKTFELQRRRVAQRGMAAPRVVPPFNELEHGRPRLSVRGQGRAGEQFALKRREEALGRIVLVRMRFHQPTIDYVCRRTAEGLSKKDIIRCLKRFVARGLPRTDPRPPIRCGLHRGRLTMVSALRTHELNAGRFRPVSE